MIRTVHTYTCPLTGDGTAENPQHPALVTVYAGTWSSRPAATDDRILVTAAVTGAEHTAILAVDGVEEVNG